MTNAATPAYDRLLSLYRCVACRKGGLNARADGLSCGSCGTTVPLRRGRFPDFLRERDGEELAAETAFWNGVAQPEPYKGESDSSYRHWARLIGCQPDSAVIEIGCAAGSLLSRLDARLKIGLEPVESLLAASTGFIGVIGTASALPFRDEVFDVVYFKHSLHHVIDKDQALAEAARVVKRGGKVIAIEPNRAHPQRILISNPRSRLRKLGWFTKLIGPVESFQTLGELREMAGRHGLELESAVFTQSHYDQLSTRQALQKIYAWALAPLLSQERLSPDFFAVFQRAR